MTCESRPTALLVLFAALAGCGRVSSIGGSHPAVPANSGVFLIAPDAPVVRDRQWHTATRLDNGKVLVAGGASGAVGGPAATAELYTAGPQTFAATGDLATARLHHTATLLDDGKVLVAGGQDAGGAALASAEIYDPGSGQFAPASGSLAAARHHHTATLQHDGSVLVAGGEAGGGPLASIERYVAGVGFQAVGNLVTARSQQSAVRVYNDETVILGGFGAGATPLASVEILDRDTGVARAAQSGLNKPRGHAAALTLSDGRILIAGGVGIGAVALDTAEIYDPVRERSNGGATMSRPRGNPRAVRLFDGRVLVTGDDSTADIFDPLSSGFVQPSSALAQPRTGHTLTPLGTGDVLIFGGGPANAPAELFDPR